MVSTRHHPKEFPEPTTPSQRASPTAPSSPTTASPVTTASSKASSAMSKASPTKALSRRRTPATATSSYVHIPTTITITWLIVSLALVFWDTGYVFLRPHSMPGGSLSNPIWTPYQKYAEVDYMYGFPAWNNHVGFTAAQASLNVAESVGYMYYLVMCWIYGGGFEGLQAVYQAGGARVQGGPPAVVSSAVLVCFSAAVMTISKTVLYCKSSLNTTFCHRLTRLYRAQRMVLWV